MIWEAAPTGKRGRQPDFSDAAIQTCLTIKVVFGMTLRQTTGFVESLTLRAGDGFVVEPGFKDTWALEAPVTKHFCIKLK